MQKELESIIETKKTTGDEISKQKKEEQKRIANEIFSGIGFSNEIEILSLNSPKAIFHKKVIFADIITEKYNIFYENSVDYICITSEDRFTQMYILNPKNTSDLLCVFLKSSLKPINTKFNNYVFSKVTNIEVYITDFSINKDKKCYYQLNNYSWGFSNKICNIRYKGIEKAFKEFVKKVKVKIKFECDDIRYIKKRPKFYDIEDSITYHFIHNAYLALKNKSISNYCYSPNFYGITINITAKKQIKNVNGSVFYPGYGYLGYLMFPKEVIQVTLKGSIPGEKNIIDEVVVLYPSKTYTTTLYNILFKK